jgi:hypothetical protein
MRIAQLNLPVFGNDGVNLDAVHNALSVDLCQFFGGFTVTQGRGAWVDAGKLYHEDVKVYQIAFDANADGVADLLRAIARDYGKAANQIAMFLVIDGAAEIITI